MYEPIGAFLHHSDWSWLTVGDGRFGLDSIRIRRLGVGSVLPTDIGEGLLKVALDDNLISDYKLENAEKLTFEDNTFDIAFCKESYHHFPRPFIALYEMLRVCRHAVVLIEPRDYVIDRPPFRVVGPIGLLKGLLSWATNRLGLNGKSIPPCVRFQLGDRPHYEDSGNYMYAISSREMEKFALGINRPAVAFKGLNDCYLPDGATALATDDSPVFRLMKDNIAKADRISAKGIASTSMLMVILFKQSPDARTREYLEAQEWLVKDLPRNPHLK